MKITLQIPEVVYCEIEQIAIRRDKTFMEMAAILMGLGALLGMAQNTIGEPDETMVSAPLRDLELDVPEALIARLEEQHPDLLREVETKFRGMLLAGYASYCMAPDESKIAN